MAIGQQVQINNLNLKQGPITEIERYFLFIGRGNGTNEGKLLTANSQTDIGELLGTNPSVLKTQVQAAKDNAGQNWNAAIYPMKTGETWSDVVDYCMTQTSAEAIVITDPITASTDLEAMQTKAVNIMAKYMRPLFFIAAARGIDTDESTGEDWPAYSAAIKPLTNSVAASNVMVIPTLWGMDQGTLAGRLCNRAVTVADSPMRVATGPLIGAWSEKPKDNKGRELDMAVLADLDKARFSVPQWYPDYDGTYWADGNMLDVEGGDYQVVENLRVVQKSMRRVYPLAVARIANRSLNSTPASTEANKTYFMGPLMAMSKSTEVLGTVFPGEIEQPADDAITINWLSKYAVELYITVTPYDSPKSITANIALDLRNQG